MAKRFTLSDKWEQKKFRKFSPEAKLLFLYILDKCDIAGFWEIDLEQAAFSIGKNTDWQVALLELSNTYLTVKEGVVWIKNFLHYQGNWPLRDNVPAHKAIARCIQEHKSFIEQLLSHLENKTSIRVTKELVNSISHSNSLSLSRGHSQGNSKKGKPKQKFIPPTLDEVKQYIKENPEIKVDATDFWKGFNDGGWIDTKGNPVRNWKLKLRTWSKYGNRPEPTRKVIENPEPFIR